jgi:hypothetical protein
MMFPHSYTSGLTWQNGKMLLGEDTLQPRFQDSVLDRFYTLEQGDMCVVDYAREYKELFKLFIMFRFVESERMSGLRYEIKTEMSHRYLEDAEDAIEAAIRFEKYVKFMKKSMPKHHAELPRLHAEGIKQQGQPAETPKQRPKFPQMEARKLEQDADRSEQFAKKVEQLKEHVVNPKQQVHELEQHATKSRELGEQAKEPTQQTETSRQLGDDSKQQLESLMEEKLVDENSFEQIHESQGKDVKFAIVGKEIDKPATIHPTVVPNTSKPVTHIILQEDKIETKEYIMMKEEIEEMEKFVPMLQHVPQDKDMSLAMMVPIIGFVIPEKFNVPIGEKDVPLSSWVQATKKIKNTPSQDFYPVSRMLFKRPRILLLKTFQNSRSSFL